MGWEKGRTSELDPLPVLSASSLLAGCPELHGKEGNTIICGHTPLHNNHTPLHNGHTPLLMNVYTC